MNKKKLGSIFVSLAVAGTILVAGASCGKKNTIKPTPTPPPPGPPVVVTTYSVTYVTDKGIAPIQVTGVTSITSLPEITDDGYYFDGWYYQNNTKANIGDKITANTTLTAKWTQKLTITYETKYGTAPEAIVGATKIEILPELTYADAIFEGWFYENGTQAQLNDEITSDVKLIAKWTDIYNISFVTNNGTTIDSYKGNKLSNLPNDMKKDNYAFDGWYYEMNFVHKANLNDTIEANTVLYAKWIKLDLYESIRHQANVILDENFNSGTIAKQTVIKKGVYSSEETNVNGQLIINNKAYANIGYGYNTGLMYITFTLTREIEEDPLSESSYDYINLMNDNSLVLSISVTPNGKLKVGTEVFENIAVNETLSIYLYIDHVDKEISVYYDNDLVTKKALASSYFTHVEFKAYDNALKLDNLAACTNLVNLEQYKSKSLEALTAAKEYYMNSEAVYKTVKPNIEAKYNSSNDLLQAATAMTDIDTIIADALETFLDEFTNQDKILNDSKALAISELNSYVNLADYSTDNQVGIASIIENGTAEINRQTSPADVDILLEQLKVQIDSIPTKASELEEEIAKYITLIKTYKVADPFNYTVNEAEYNFALADAKALINAATSKDAVKDAYDEACLLIDAVEDDFTALSNIKLEKIDLIDKYAVYAYNANDEVDNEDWDIIDEGIYNLTEAVAAAIDDATSVNEIDEIIAKYVTDIDELAASLVTGFADVIEALKDSIVSRCDTNEQASAAVIAEYNKVNIEVDTHVVYLWQIYLNAEVEFNSAANNVMYNETNMKLLSDNVLEVEFVKVFLSNLPENKANRALLLVDIYVVALYHSYNEEAPIESFAGTILSKVSSAL